MKKVSGVLVGSLVGAALFAAGALRAQDDGGVDDPVEPLRLHGYVELDASADDSAASGFAYLRQKDDRAAVHVHVRGLEPGASYDVVVSSGDDSGSLGTLTTRDDVPPPPRCFRALLTAPDDGEDTGDTGEGGGAGHRDWPSRDRHPRAPGGSAELVISSDETSIRYMVYYRGVEGDAVVSVAFGDEVVVLDGNWGAIDASEALVAALRDGSTTVSVSVGDVVALSGAAEPCVSESFREHIAARRAGRGSLRVDTARGDTLPLGATSLTDLVGATISVVDGDGNAVLAGEIGELMQSLWRPRSHRDGDGGGGAGSGDDGDEFFAIVEPHDASFTRGDANDDETVDIADAIAVLGYLFQGGAIPYCPDAVDVDDNGEVELSDPILILKSLFQGQAAPRVGVRGFDRQADLLYCDSSSS